MDILFSQAESHIPAQDIEIFSQQWDEDSVSFEMDRLKEIKSQNIEGFSIRLIKDGRIGFATATGEGKNDLVERALSTIAFGPKAGFILPQTPPPPSPVRIFDPVIDSLTVENLADKGRNILAYLREKKPAYQYDISLNRYVENRHLFSRALDLAYRKTAYSFSIGAHSYKEGDFFALGDGYSCALMESDERTIANRILELLELTEQFDTISTGVYPVVFSPGAFREILEPVLVGLNGKAVEKGSSPLADKMEKKVFPDSVTITDDGTIDGTTTAAPFDDEGIPVAAKPLIEKGVIRNFVLDLRTAGALKMTPTGNGKRSYTSMPHPSSYGVVFQPGNETKDSLIRGIKEGLYIEQLIGGHTTNFFSGDFQMNVDMGLKITNGELTGRVKNVMIGGNIYRLFDALTGLTSERRWISKFYLPYARFDSVTVAGK